MVGLATTEQIEYGIKLFTGTNYRVHKGVADKLLQRLKEWHLGVSNSTDKDYKKIAKELEKKIERIREREIMP